MGEIRTGGSGSEKGGVGCEDKVGGWRDETGDSESRCESLAKTWILAFMKGDREEF